MDSWPTLIITRKATSHSDVCSRIAGSHGMVFMPWVHRRPQTLWVCALPGGRRPSLRGLLSQRDSNQAIGNGGKGDERQPTAPGVQEGQIFEAS